MTIVIALEGSTSSWRRKVNHVLDNWVLHSVNILFNYLKNDFSISPLVQGDHVTGWYRGIM